MISNHKTVRYETNQSIKRFIYLIKLFSARSYSSPGTSSLERRLEVPAECAILLPWYIHGAA